MKDKDYFFKPYRQRIHDMYQQHDSLTFEQNQQQNEQIRQQYSPQRQRQRKYFGHSPSYANINKPWLNNSGNRNKDYSPENYSYSYGKASNSSHSPVHPSRKHTRLARQMHEPIWEHLYNQGIKVQKQIQQAHQNKKGQIDTQCTFQPMLRKNSRYRLPTSSNFLERNYIWQQNKLQKIVKQKQEQVVKDLQNCTFKPQLNKNKNYKVKNTEYHHLNIKNKSKSRHALHATSGDHNNFVFNMDNNYGNPSYSFNPNANNEAGTNKDREKAKERQKQRERERINREAKEREKDKKNTANSFNRQEVGKIKNIIRSELKRIQF